VLQGERDESDCAADAVTQQIARDRSRSGDAAWLAEAVAAEAGPQSKFRSTWREIDGAKTSAVAEPVAPVVRGVEPLEAGPHCASSDPPPAVPEGSLFGLDRRNTIIVAWRGIAGEQVVGRVAVDLFRGIE
jgi:hypothetical protein